MDFKNYEEFVIGIMSPASVKNFESKLATAGLGLAGEGGEAADLAKKILFHGLEFDDNVRQKMIKELGDQLFYIAFTARMVCDVGLQEVLDQNVEKLSARYEGGKFSTEAFLKKENSK